MTALFLAAASARLRLVSWGGSRWGALALLCGGMAWLGGIEAPPCRGAAGDMLLTLTVTAKGQATIAQAMSDSCEATFTARLVYRPDPATGRYSRPAEEQYTMAASGNGHILNIENWTYTELQPHLGSASLVFMPKDGKAVIGWGYVDDHIRSEPEAGQGSERMARTHIKMAEDDLIMNPDSGVVTFTPNAADFTATGSCRGEYSDMFGSGHITATYTLRRQGEELDAVILPPKDYASWMPQGGPDSSTPGTNPVVVMAELRLRGTEAPPPVRKARFRFELVNGSKEPGICLNDPPKGEAKSEFDLQFGKAKGIEPTQDKQRYETEELSTTGSAVILCYDYGAAARLKVTAITDMGEEIEAHREDKPAAKWLDLPEDENTNRVADSWEREQGTWGKAEQPDWDEADDPKDQDGKGDGISLYEKYRGFRFDRTHERLEAKKKHVFIYDPDSVVRLNLSSVMSFEAASQLRVRFVENRTWTGSGAAGSKKRIVNFNTSGFGHAIDQHALHVRVVNAKSPTLPSDYQDLFKAKYGHPDNMDISKYYGMTYNDFTGVANMESPGGILVIELYPWGTQNISQSFVEYHTLGLAKFADFFTAPAADRNRMVNEAVKLAAEHIQTHPTEWEEQNFLYLLAGATHELGHGVSIDDLVPPHTGGPLNCYMRYIAWDFPMNSEDRMEITARWHNASTRPQQFCRDATATVPGKGCFHQIHITDRKPPGPSLQRLPPQSAPHPEDARSQWLAAASVPDSPLRVEAGLEWDDLLAGDPLRFTVRLSWPSMMNAWALALHQRGTQAATPTFPAIASTWANGLRLELNRLEPTGGRTVIAPQGSWDAARRPIAFDPAGWENRLGTRTREFLTDPASVPLTEGIYALSVRWDGRGSVDPSLLPASGIVDGGELQFEVRRPTEAQDRPTQLRRLAFRAWDRNDFDTARQRGQEALNLAPTDTGREAIDTAWVVAAANLKLGDLRAAFQTLAGLQNQPGAIANREIALTARMLANVLAPSVSLAQWPMPGRIVSLDIAGHAGQTYELQASSDLVHWEPVDRRTVSSPSAYRVEDSGGGTTAAARFYRVVWLP